ncbi:TonB family protein [Undibacterium crateris]|uniref:TonB family protein n=1 Tax=Undibacterium crateris TaxID=2528175 RepID=UPI00138946E1|nr:TonB family protein [Undibacterium crateris]NDI87064.1 TonB family protein [Undibacterium crateris]
MTLIAHHSAAQLHDEVKRRLSLGLLVSVLLHVLVLSLRFGIPGSGPAAPLSSAPSASEQRAEVPQLALRITMPAPPVQSSATSPASAPAEKAQPASTPALSSIAPQSRASGVAVNGIQLIAPRLPAAVLAPPPTSAKTTKTKRAHASQAPVAPKRKIALSEVKAVIAQDQFRLDSFVVAAQAPEDIKKVPEEETERRRFPDPVSQSGEEKEDDPVAVAPERYQADAEKRQRKQAERERQLAAQLSETSDMRSQQTLVSQIQQTQKSDIEQFRLAQAETDRQEQEKAEQEKRAAELRELKKQEQEKQEQLRQEQQLQQAHTAAENRLTEMLQQRSQPAAVVDAGLQQLAQDKQMRELQKNQRNAALQKRELEREQEQERQQLAAQQQREAELQAAAKAAQVAQAAQIAAAQASMADKAQSQARAAQVIAGNSSVSQHAAPAQGMANAAGAGAGVSVQAQTSQSGNGSASSNGHAAMPGAGSGNGSTAGNGSALASASQASLQSDLANRLREQARGLDLLRGAPPVPRESAEKSRRRSVFSNSERDVQLRAYADSWKQKIERNGNLNYSSTARDKARGDPIVTVAIRSDGTVEEVTIHRSSGRMDLDQAVRNIVRLNARYAAFPPAVAAQYDVIEIRRIWSFDDSLRILEELR